MPNLVITFAEVLAGAVVLDAAIKGDSIPNVIRGQATQHSLPGADTSGAAGGTSASGVLGADTLAPGTYTNPVPGASTGRIDQGVDYTGKQFLAPGKSQVLVSDQSSSGWGGGGYVAAKLLDGPLAGSVYYFAEGIAPSVKAGDTVNAGTVLGIPITNPFNQTLGNIEAGWADPASPSRPLAQSLSGYGGDQSTQALTAGYSFSKFVQALGGVAGVFQGAGQAISSAVQHEFGAGHTPAGVPFG